MTKILFAMAYISLLVSTQAKAEWYIRTDGPDVFGATKVTAVNSGSGGNTLVIKCDTSDELEIAFLVKAKDASISENRPATMLFQFDGAAPIQSDAQLESWNDNHVAISVTERTAKSVALIRAIGSTKQKLNIGVIVGSIKDSSSFDSIRASSVMNTLLKTCKLNTITS